MKTTVLLLTALVSAIALATTGPARTLWNLNASQPESVYFEAAEGVLYVSNIAGAAPGWISKLNTKGEVLKEKWFTNLNNPKGMRSVAGVLYVSDGNRVVGIDLKTAVEVMNITIPEAEFLNDVATGADGSVYVSDTMADRIYVIRDGVAAVFAEGLQLQSPNGLLVDGEDLLVAGWGTNLKADWSVDSPGGLYKINLKSKKITAIVDGIGQLDGLEKTDDGYMISDYVAGSVIAVKADGKLEVLQDGYGGAADLAYVPGKKGGTVFLPRSGDDKVTAIRVK